MLCKKSPFGSRNFLILSADAEVKVCLFKPRIHELIAQDKACIDYCEKEKRNTTQSQITMHKILDIRGNTTYFYNATSQTLHKIWFTSDIFSSRK